jgi:hypothetical protein
MCHHLTWFYLQEISTKGKKVGLCLGGYGDRVLITKEYRVSFQGDKNVLNCWDGCTHL